MGVIAAVAGLVTGAAGPGGFKGIAGRFARDRLIQFESGTGGSLTLVRPASGRAAIARYRPELVPADPEMRSRLHLVLSGEGTRADQTQFAALWQDRVRRILVDFADHPELVTIKMR